MNSGPQNVTGGGYWEWGHCDGQPYERPYVVTVSNLKLLYNNKCAKGDGIKEGRLRRVYTDIYIRGSKKDRRIKKYVRK